MNCFSNKNDKFEKNFLSTLYDLKPYQINSIKIRYIALVNEYRTRCRRYDIVYHYGRFIANVSSVLVPALLSIEFTGVNNEPTKNIDMIAVFWLTWVLSLIVTVLNNTIGIFRIEKKYYLLHIILSQLMSEGAQYEQLTGRYSGFLIENGVVPNHSNQFVFFVHAVERIIMRETDIEYFKLYDGNNNLNILNRQDTSDGADIGGKGVPMRKQLSHAGQALYHPSPDRPITAETTPLIPPSPPLAQSVHPSISPKHPILTSNSSTSSQVAVNMLVIPGEVDEDNIERN